jgi:hypothetical protein
VLPFGNVINRTWVNVLGQLNHRIHDGRLGEMFCQRRFCIAIQTVKEHLSVRPDVTSIFRFTHR